MRFFAVAAIVSTLHATALVAAYASRDAWIPVAGKTAGATGRNFDTNLYITDLSKSANDVTISFFPLGASDISRSLTVHLRAGQSKVVSVGPELTGTETGIGALQVRSTGALMAQAHLFTTDFGDVVNAIPSPFAIGAGDATIVQVPPAGRYRLYAVETTGFPLYFSVASGRGERRLIIRPHEHRVWDLADILPGPRDSALTITGVNGSGKIIVLGTAIAEQTQDFSAYEMLMPTKARHRMTWPEMTAYAAVAVAIACSAIYRMKRPASG